MLTGGCVKHYASCSELCVLNAMVTPGDLTSDDRSVVFENGEPRPTVDRAPKFAAVGGHIVALLGRSDVCAALRGLFEMMVETKVQTIHFGHRRTKKSEFGAGTRM